MTSDRFRASESIFLSWQRKEHVSYVKPITVVYIVSICTIMIRLFSPDLFSAAVEDWSRDLYRFTESVWTRRAEIWVEEHKQKVKSATVALVIGRNKGWCELRGVLIFVAFLTSPVIIMYPTAFPNTTSAFSLHALFKRLWLHPLLASCVRPAENLFIVPRMKLFFSKDRIWQLLICRIFLSLMCRNSFIVLCVWVGGRLLIELQHIEMLRGSVEKWIACRLFRDQKVISYSWVELLASSDCPVAMDNQCTQRHSLS